ncbi:MAG: aminoacyl-tRNA hydrolase [Myxococcales bacterium]|nr:aminoacyl-tRNA hydrolase [Myxococcales bacterium]MCB9642556.1 aminoacyl-tRNA hydrolase [Myxococcales bacterium]
MFTSEEIEIQPGLSIPYAELEFRYARSGGPGGQHVNKVESKVLLFFNIASSPSLSDEQRALLLERLHTRLDKEGVLQVTSQQYRSQHRNREEAIVRFQSLLAEALTEQAERKPTKVPRSIVRRRLENKRQQSQRKQDRGWRWDG